MVDSPHQGIRVRVGRRCTHSSRSTVPIAVAVVHVGTHTCPRQAVGGFFMPLRDRDRMLGLSEPITSPIYPSSVYSVPDLDALEAISSGREVGFTYARDGHPNGSELARQLSRLEKAAWGVVTSSGMGAITATLTTLLQAGDRVIASDQLYGRTAQWLRQEISRFGVTTNWVDTSDMKQVRAAPTERAKTLIVETISNPLLRICD